MFDALTRDLRYGARSLAKRPLITAVAVLSLALGIGVNTAIFSVFERRVLRELPVPAPEEIVNVTSPGPRPGSNSSSDSGGEDHIFSYPLFRDLERLEKTGLSRIVAHRDFPANVAHGGTTTRGDGLLVSGSYFDVLGVRPALGRLLTPGDDRVAGGHPVVVLAHAYWTTRFGSDPSVIGQTLILNGQSMTVLGVAAAGFSGTTTTEQSQLFVPLAMAGTMRGPSEQRNDHWLYLTARLEPGFTRDRAQTVINGPFTSIIRDVEYPAQRRGMGDRARQEFLARQIVLEDGGSGRSADRDRTRLSILLMLAVAGVVLLIACVNLANLMLARATDRSAEIALRLSIGATPRRVIRLLMAEASLLAILGGVGALIVARVAMGALLATMPADQAARLSFELNQAVLLFTLALSVGTSVVFGLFPAVHALRHLNAHAAAQPGRVSDSRSTRRLRTALATAQIALATSLLAVAGLFVASLFNVAGEELGIQRDGIIAFRLSPYLNGYTRDRALALFDRVQDDLRGTPGVTAVTASTIPVLSDNGSFTNLTVEGFEGGPDADTTTSVARIGTDYFRTLGIPLLAGREFSTADAADTPRVAIVNEAFARKFAFGGNAIGKRLATGAGGNRPLNIQIVGLVRDAKYSDIKTPAPPQLFLAYRQGAFDSLTVYARSSSDARQLRSVIPALVGRADPNLPVDRLRTMDEQIWDNASNDRFLATLSSWFAALALLLAGIGLYAVLAYTVAQRVREIGIRMAMGARPADVWRLVFSYVGRIALIGGAIGVAAAIGLGRLAESLLFGVQGNNAALLAGAGIAMAAVAVAAAAVPARRAIHVNPVNALRAD
jgi:putative ABC transport system permease protein